MADDSGPDEALDAPDPWGETAELPTATDPAEASADVLPTVRSIWAWWSWTMVAVVAMLIGVAVFVDILRPSIVLDLLSFWPLFALVAIAAVVWSRRRTVWPARMGAAIALLALTGLLGTVALHLLAWSPLPSSVVVDGPSFSGGGAQLGVLAGQGAVILESGPIDRAFQASLLPRGGPVAMARATGIESDPLRINLVQRGDPGLHRSEGWQVTIAESGRWVLSVQAVAIEADLRSTTVGNSVFEGAGTVQLDGVVPGSRIELAGGPFEIAVPAGVGIGVEGVAEVPAGWTVTEAGASSPEGSGGFVIVVVDETAVQIVQS